jgi:hypothetical protein
VRVRAAEGRGRDQRAGVMVHTQCLLTPTPTLRFVVIFFCSSMLICRNLDALLLAEPVCKNWVWDVAREIRRPPITRVVRASRFKKRRPIILRWYDLPSSLLPSPQSMILSLSPSTPLDCGPYRATVWSLSW